MAKKDTPKELDWNDPKMKKARAGTLGNRDLPENVVIPGPYGKSQRDIGAEADTDLDHDGVGGDDGQSPS